MKTLAIITASILATIKLLLLASTAIFAAMGG